MSFFSIFIIILFSRQVKRIVLERIKILNELSLLYKIENISLNKTFNNIYILIEFEADSVFVSFDVFLKEKKSKNEFIDENTWFFKLVYLFIIIVCVFSFKLH
jgi:hypothetical protein